MSGIQQHIYFKLQKFEKKIKFKPKQKFQVEMTSISVYISAYIVI